MSPTHRQEKPVGIALKNPWRRVADVFARENAYHHRHIGERLKSLEAVKQHRLSGHPAELFELV
jgi:hypothetical protein